MSQYQLCEPLRTFQGEEDFRERLDKGIRELFTAVYHRVFDVCQEEHLLVTTIGLSVPSQWTVEFMELYRGIVADVFMHLPEDIFFVTEVEALARYLCTKKMNRLVQHQNDVHNAVVVMLDFGGHTSKQFPMLLSSPSGLSHKPNFLQYGVILGQPKHITQKGDSKLIHHPEKGNY